MNPYVAAPETHVDATEPVRPCGFSVLKDVRFT